MGYDIIDVLPWDEWWNFELTKDESNPHISLLPLHPDVRAKFNETAAWEYALSVVGKLSWIETIDGNYPPPLDAHVVASVMTVWNNVQPDYAANIKLKGVGSSFDELLTIPEQDNWIYSDGKATSSVVFILEMYKEVGWFDPIANSIEVTEFTIKDAYTLKFFENNSSHLPKWCNDADTVKLPFCQIRGKYRMDLPGYNTMDPYPHMNERCHLFPQNTLSLRVVKGLLICLFCFDFFIPLL
ncbi:unnamed protein product [Camellia sinensis]